MLIYFTASMLQKNQYGHIYDKIISLLEEMGHKVIYERIIQAPLEEKRLYPEEQRKAHYKEVVKWISDAEIVVGEVSYPSSINIGHEIRLALEKGKPVICLYAKDKESIFFEGIQSDRFVYEEYDEESLERILQSAIQFAQDQSDTRFNFFVFPQHVAYLDEVSRRRKIPKSVYLRELIEQDKRKNKDYDAS